MLIRRLRRIARTRTALSLAALLSLAASSFEAVAGDMRDGDEHHESVVAALEHRVAKGAEHRHLAESRTPEHPGAPAPDHGGQHHHPGGTDHCSHLHGVGIPPSFSIAFGASMTEEHTVTTSRAASFSPSARPRPPRA
jgi:hypothetical protein